MKIPSTGKECPYFYGDYYRGREHEECRLLSNASSEWSQKDCQSCPVPEILLANSCPNMILTSEIKKGLLGIGRKVEISAYCKKTHRDVKNPYVGCGECHPILDLFKEVE
ncbi:MAG: hypothetical protein H0S79_18740 [Anaerolineaceae bacterium]|nr:hypothetical protein [Anaerolineaceae bacterium]